MVVKSGQNRIELGTRPGVVSSKLFEAEEKWASANSDIDSLKAELESTQKRLEAEVKQVEAFTESIKSQGNEASEKLNDLELKLSQKDDEVIQLNHKLESGLAIDAIFFCWLFVKRY